MNMSSAPKSSSHHFCSICEISLNSDAELALHEFSKRHCENLLRASKKKPLKGKTTKLTQTQSLSEVHVESSVSTPPSESGLVNIALYGYFNPSETVDTKPKEFNVEYDPYLQKLAENPYKQTQKSADVPIFPTINVTTFSKTKNKKKKSCQICNVSTMNVPEYEAHMKSAQHAWKLKVSGMGVSAHFVKASTDLHTTDKDLEVSLAGQSGQPTETVSYSSVPIPISPADLYCDTCGLLLNSQVQFQAHITGKSHLDKIKLKEQKNAAKVPVANQLFCYTCRLPLNNLLQFNDHKNGKKHKAKCLLLQREGYTIPPEERPTGVAWTAPSTVMPPRYPELYEKEVIERQLISPSTSSNTSAKPPTTTPSLLNFTTGMHHCPQCSERFSTAARLGLHINSHATTSTSSPTVSPLAPAMDINQTSLNDSISSNDKTETSAKNNFECSICVLKFAEQPPFEMHLNSEDHALKIFETKKIGINSRDILEKLMKDRSVILPDRYGRRCCGICAVVSQTPAEVEQHLQSLVHKYAEKDYKKKRLLEIQQSLAANDDGAYHCRLCEASWPTLTTYNVHLHSPGHRNIFWKEHIKKNSMHRWLYTGKGGKPFRSRIDANARNPGVRTKVGGIAKDLSSGIVEPVPNLEPIEPKIDQSKNVQLGISAQTTGVNKSINKIRKKTILPARRLPGMVYPIRPQAVPPLITAQRPAPPPAQNLYHPPLRWALRPIGVNRFHPYAAPGICNAPTRMRLLRPPIRSLMRNYMQPPRWGYNYYPPRGPHWKWY